MQYQLYLLIVFIGWLGNVKSMNSGDLHSLNFEL